MGDGSVVLDYSTPPFPPGLDPGVFFISQIISQNTNICSPKAPGSACPHIFCPHIFRPGGNPLGAGAVPLYMAAPKGAGEGRAPEHMFARSCARWPLITP